MKRVLLVKMSSLGDVVHALPAVTDACRALDGDVTFDWVVEEAFAAIPARHRGVDRVLPIAWRRWRGELAASVGAMRAFLGSLRERRYDMVLDAQGLIKSAAVSALARGPATGLARGSAREGAAALFYRRQVAVPRGQHAIDRLRVLFAEALRYRLPAGPPEYGITAAPADAPPSRDRCFLLHGTTWESKLWPVRFWRALAEHAAAAGFDVVVPWGDEVERKRAAEIAADTPARVLERLPLAALMHELAGAGLVVGVDSGLAHLAAALEAPTVVMYGSTSSTLTGVRGRRARALQSELPCSPCMTRVCTYNGPAQYWNGEVVMPACYASLPPDKVWQAAQSLVSGSRDADRLLHL